MAKHCVGMKVVQSPDGGEREAEQYESKCRYICLRSKLIILAFFYFLNCSIRNTSNVPLLLLKWYA